MRTRSLATLTLACAPLASQPMLGADAPEIDFKDVINLEGASKLSDLRGRVIMLDFFATW